MHQRKQAIAAEIPRLRRYARALCGSEPEADDLVQETLARALTHIDRWQHDSSPRKWLFSILHNHFIDGRRKSSRQPQQLSIDDGEVVPMATGTDFVIRRDLDQGLQSLSPQHRQVLLLVGLEGLTYAETADALGVPIGTVMSRLARARERLRGLMACDIGENDAPPALMASLRGIK
jgi:RNA polymerase sigma-70 factor, ECF subfamily